MSQKPLLTYTFPALTSAPVWVGVLGGEFVDDWTACRHTGAALVPVFSWAEFG
ncbi:hypothetical protein GCM10009828_087060 [Actinoplanes couchii]|uniref:Uncharacterized protein n=1 Tax=Actinoplanes couchii TaxID=403638 RepID=A0ABQ3XT44_9ACTN|nr:hypothetical protein Aco03nite_100790 [Actinoplanes couchii]